jgi:hypothetical protein
VIIDITLAFVFIASIFTLWHRISVKIPELIVIPNDVITAGLKNDSAKFRVLVLRVKAAYEEKRLRAGLLKVLGKVLHRFHIVIMRLDNWLLARLKKIREKGYYSGNGAVSSGVADNAFSAESSRNHKIEEVKIKK